MQPQKANSSSHTNQCSVHGQRLMSGCSRSFLQQRKCLAEGGRGALGQKVQSFVGTVNAHTSFCKAQAGTRRRCRSNKVTLLSPTPAWYPGLPETSHVRGTPAYSNKNVRNRADHTKRTHACVFS